MIRAVLAVATDRGVSVLKPGQEATQYDLAGHGLIEHRCLALAQAGNGHLTVGTEKFFVQTSPNGLTWKPSMTGLERPYVTALARHPRNPGLLALGHCPPGVAITQNNGETWQKLSPLESLENATRWSYPAPPYRARVSTLAFHPDHESVLFCGIEVGGLVATNDSGRTWVPRYEGLPVSVRAVALPYQTLVYAATAAGFFRSEDLGTSWVEASHGLPYKRIEAMAVATENPNVVLLGLSSAPPGRTTGGTALALTLDGGQSWNVSNDGLPRMDDRTVTSLTFGSGGFYAGTDRGDLFLLNNLEGHWTRVAANLPPIRALLTLS